MAERIIIQGTVRNGVVVPDGDVKLPEGARVDIILPIPGGEPEAAEAGTIIDQWEREE